MKHVIFAMVKIATVMETVQTTKMIIHVNVNQNTWAKTVNKEISVTMTHAHMETVQILLMVISVRALEDTQVVVVMW